MLLFQKGGKMRKNKTKVQRVDGLTEREFKILMFLWKWKVASYPTLKEAVSRNTNTWNFYHNLRRLDFEGYIELKAGSMSDGRQFLLWTLTEHGYEYIREGLGVLKNETYGSEKLFHDKYALAFQLGNLIYHRDTKADIITRQELTSFYVGYYPVWTPQTEVHYPDGYTRLKDGNKNVIIAHEIEMYPRSPESYEPFVDFYDDKTSINFVLWLVAKPEFAERLEEVFVSRRCRRRQIHHIFLMDDFDKYGWETEVYCGPQKSLKLSELYHQYGYHIPTNDPLIPSQPSFKEVFLKAVRSPVGLDSYKFKRKLLLSDSTTTTSNDIEPSLESSGEEPLT